MELRKTLPTFGARRLIREFDLRIGHNALERIWREHGLIKKRRRKYQRKQDLAHIKASWALFQQISADTKDLDDITEREWAQDARRPGEEYMVKPLHEYRAAWALVRQWAGHDAAVAQREEQIQKLERLVWDAVYAVQKAHLDSEAARLRRAIERA